MRIAIARKGKDIQYKDLSTAEQTQFLAEQQKIANKKASEWKRRRKQAYPSVGDGLDAMWHYLNHIKANDSSAFNAMPKATKDWFMACDQVKRAIPKPGA